jgi:hypothetical protein
MANGVKATTYGHEFTGADKDIDPDDIYVRRCDYAALGQENAQLREENTKLKQPVSDAEKIRSIALAAAREIAESFNISTPRGMSYSNGILHTIRDHH